jgi:hypothetical protein
MAELHVQPRKNRNWWIWLLILILIIAVVVYWYMNYYHGELKVAYNLLHVINGNNYYSVPRLQVMTL